MAVAQGPFLSFPYPFISPEYSHSDFHGIFKQVNLRDPAVSKQGYFEGHSFILILLYGLILCLID